MTLNKELCELLEIEPVPCTIGGCNKACGYDACSFFTDEPIYPDFENNNNNFVKLTEEMFKFPMTFPEKETYKISVLNGAIEAAKTNKMFKQAIKQIEFEY